MGNRLKYTPAKAERWVNCPGSVNAEAAFPDEESDAAREGKACHELAALVLGDQPKTTEDPFAHVGGVSKNGVVFTERMAEMVACYQKELATWAGGAQPLVEFRVVSEEFPGWGGYLDAGAMTAHADSKALYVGDLKTGWGVVEAKGNWQLINYALLLLEWLGPVAVQNVETVHMVIVQPGPLHVDGPVRYWTVTKEEVLAYRPVVIEAMRAAERPGAPFKTGSHCRGCRAIRSCPAAQQAALAAIDVSKVGSLRQLSGAEIANERKLLVESALRIKSRLKGLEAEIEARLRESEYIPGLSLVSVVGRERWVDGKDVSLIEKMTGKKITKPAYVTPKQARKLGVPERIVAQFAETPTGGLKLAEVDSVEKAKEIIKNVK